VVKAGHLSIVPVACGRYCGLGWTLLRCLCDAALIGGCVGVWNAVGLTLVNRLQSFRR
jgi:hypothetical protein